VSPVASQARRRHDRILDFRRHVNEVFADPYTIMETGPVIAVRLLRDHGDETENPAIKSLGSDEATLRLQPGDP
jgi:hypothetical protein